jgi:mRNA-degrading endonuclease toxin of MazEF toxin-antitoxin module
MNRGDIVIVDFSPASPSAGIRPAVVVQNDRDNARMQNTIVAQVTSNIRRAQEDTQLLIDPACCLSVSKWQIRDLASRVPPADAQTEKQTGWWRKRPPAEGGQNRANEHEILDKAPTGELF